VWAGNTPGGFDCSGFTQYVILNTVGIDIGHGTAGQMNYGAWVDWGAWEPGDLVYFAGTWDAGISHTGVYIGDGMFIHAENESTGVTISSLYSDYYAGHYYGAIRVR
jgi:cell wall-associated NlpC family hydrolase